MRHGSAFAVSLIAVLVAFPGVSFGAFSPPPPPPVRISPPPPPPPVRVTPPPPPASNPTKVTPPPASFGGKSSTPPSSATKSSGSGKSNSPSTPSRSASRTPTSTSGPTSLKAPITKLVPKASPVKIARYNNPKTRPKYVPRGANYNRDYRKMSKGSYRHGGTTYLYRDPYGPQYFGFYGPGNNPFLMYLFIDAWMDDDTDDNPPAPRSADEVDMSLITYMEIIKAMQSYTVGKER